MLMVVYCFTNENKFVLLLLLVPSNVEKFGYAFARAIRFKFKDHIRLSTWIESKMFGSQPDDGIDLIKLSFSFLLNDLFFKVKKQVGNVY
jgi:hypothetical protein